MDIPEAMIDTQCHQMMDDFGRRMQSQGLSMEQYFQFTGQSMDKMMEDMKPQALKRIQTRLVLEKVVETENIEAVSYTHLDVYKRQGNPYFISLEDLIQEGVLTEKECNSVDFGNKADDIDYEKLYKGRYKLCLLYTSRCV